MVNEKKRLVEFFDKNKTYIKKNIEDIRKVFITFLTDEEIKKIRLARRQHFYSKVKTVKDTETLGKSALKLKAQIIEGLEPKSKLKFNKNFDVTNVLVIPDTHFPFEREGSLRFLKEVQREFKCGTIVHIGDVVDNHYSSFHESDPDGKSAGDELSYAIEHLKPFYEEFPKAKVCLGNHDLIINRKAYSSGLSKRWIKGLDEILEVPGWEFDVEHELYGVLYTHGTGTSGNRAAFNKALNRRMSTVQGHLHSEASVTWNVSSTDIIFGMQVGCLVDDRKYAFDYAKANPRKFIVSCGVVLNSGKLPIVIPMEL